jgi:hypothetical protein
VSSKPKRNRSPGSRYYGDDVPDDSQEHIKLSSGQSTWMSVNTYKESITVHTPGEIVWMSADVAEKVGRSLLRAAKHRRKIDAALKRKAIKS